MGLFSSVIHLRGAAAKAIPDELDAIVEAAGFRLRWQRKVPAGGPRALAEYRKSTGPLYFVGKDEPWIPIIQGAFPESDDLWISQVALELSRKLRCVSLCLVLHDDDVVFMDLNRGGEQLDGYNSNPQYFEEKRLSKKAVEQQRHSMDPFRDFVTPVHFEELKKTLARGWWSAYDRGALDSDGVVVDEADWVDEAERMTKIGTVLGLAGRRAYPFTDWAENSRVDWGRFTARSYACPLGPPRHD